jgi:hypothetical protein
MASSKVCGGVSGGGACHAAAVLTATGQERAPRRSCAAVAGELLCRLSIDQGYCNVRNWPSQRILEVLDKCCDSFTFPMLDNGYVYLAATRMSVYRSEADWAIVLEVFGFSPRAGIPDTHVYSFSSALNARKTRGEFVNEKAYEQYLFNNPYNESSFVFPIQEGDWLDAENSELVAPGPHDLVVRGRTRHLPTAEEYARSGITHSQTPRIAVFELCRSLAFSDREHVLATAAERRTHLRPELRQILQLEEWNHPDVVQDEHRPSNSETFEQLAQVLVTGDVHLYEPIAAANTHWKNWPNGGTL